MLAHCKSLIGCSVMLVTYAVSGFAQEPEHFYQFFEKGQIVQVSSSSSESQFLSAVILTPDDAQRMVDAQSLDAEEIVKKYPDPSDVVGEALKAWPRLRQRQGLAEDAKPQVVLTSGRSSFAYRVIAPKSDYLLVESLSSPPTKIVFAVDKIKTITWSKGLEARVVPQSQFQAR